LGYSFKKYSLEIFWSLVVSIVISPFSSLILLIWVFFLLFGRLDWEFVNLFYLFKEPTFYLIYTFYCSLVSSSLIFTLIFVIFFHLLLLGLACSCSSKTLRYIAKLFILDLRFKIFKISPLISLMTHWSFESVFFCLCVC
jgi:hypothetical protein